MKYPIYKIALSTIILSQSAYSLAAPSPAAYSPFGIPTITAQAGTYDIKN